jgi:hypothetical protein
MISGVSQRLEKVERDLAAIALTIQDLTTRVSEVEGVGDIDYAVTPISELEAVFDSRSESLEFFSSYRCCSFLLP